MTTTDDENSQYEPFASFSSWLTESCNVALVETYRSLKDEASAMASLDDRKAALDNVMRTAALETGAIEDLYETNRRVTITVAGMAAGWEAQLDEIGPQVRSHFEAQLEAFEMVLDLATKKQPVSAAFIRQLHEQTTRNQRTYRAHTPVGVQDVELHHGQYKTQPNTVLTADGEYHWYAPVQDTEPEMTRLVSELSTEAFMAAPAQLQAAFAHYAFVAIHPFEDGNGRVARALASVFLYRYGGVPLVIFSDQKARYWSALKAADCGNRSAFLRFVEDRLIDTLSTVRLLLSVNQPVPTDSQRLVQQLLNQPRDRTPQELLAIGRRINEAMNRSLDAAWREALQLVAPAGLTTTTQVQPLSGQLANWDHQYLPVGNGAEQLYNLHMPEPIPLAIGFRPALGMASNNMRHQFMLSDPDRVNTHILYIRPEDADPEISASLQLQIDGWTRAATKNIVDEFLAAIRSNLT
jgi:Fic family protein